MNANSLISNGVYFTRKLIAGDEGDGWVGVGGRRQRVSVTANQPHVSACETACMTVLLVS